MISVITCTKDDARLATLRAAYSAALEPGQWELIHIPDARSTAEGYNRAVSISRGDVILFTGDNVVEFLKPGLAGRLARHLEEFDLVGTLGTRLLAGNDWLAAGYPHLFGQSAELDTTGKISLLTFGAPRPGVGGMQALHGVVLAARRSVFSRVAFDQKTFDGSDLCEMDLSVSAHVAGLRLGVACDLFVLHTTPLPPSATRALFAQRFEMKWAHLLKKMPVYKQEFIRIFHVDRQTTAAAMEPPYWRNATQEESLPAATDGPVPMISVIAGSEDAARLSAVRSMYGGVMADAPWEFIGIQAPHSLAGAYSQAVADSKGEILVFSHDDVEILSPQFPQRLAQHLKTYDLVGVAGTLRLSYPVWICAGPPFIVGQVAHPDGNNFVVNSYAVPRRVVGGLQAIDGVFMAARRSTFSKINFDAQTFDGFHLYDMDFSYSAYHAGLRVAVANDIHILHHSLGVYAQTWETYANRFLAKWKHKLPSGERELIRTRGNLVFASNRDELRRIMSAPAFLREP